MKIILFLIGIVALLSLCSALEINAGESYVFSLENYAYYTISGNTTEIDLNVSQNGNLVEIIVGKYNPTGSFEITFFDEKDEVIYSSGGHSHTKKIYVDRNITKYVDVPCSDCGGGATNNTNETPIYIPTPNKSFPWELLIISILIGIMFFTILIVLFKRRKIDERRYKKDGKMQKEEK